MFASCKVYHEGKTESSRYDFNATADIAPDSETTDLIEPYKIQLDAKMNQVIGYAEQELFKKLPECRLGNWAADAIYDQCNKLYKKPIDFAVVNYGGIRIPSMPKGDVTTGKIFELMPFDNAMVILEVKGDIVQQLFENIAGRGGWPISGQVRCSFNTEGKLLDVTINGEAIDNDMIYQIGISDYVANGGDKCSFFKDQPRRDTGVLFRDAFMQQVKDLTAQGKNIDAAIEGRMLVK